MVRSLPLWLPQQCSGPELTSVIIKHSDCTHPTPVATKAFYRSSTYPCSQHIHHGGPQRSHVTITALKCSSAYHCSHLSTLMILGRKSVALWWSSVYHSGTTPVVMTALGWSSANHFSHHIPLTHVATTSLC